MFGGSSCRLSDKNVLVEVPVQRYLFGGQVNGEVVPNSMKRFELSFLET